MSQALAPQLRDLGKMGTVYEVIGQSGTTYMFFWFGDGSVCAARKEPAGNRAAAQWVFVEAKPSLDDCGVADFAGNTYQKGIELRKRLEQ